MDLPLINAPFSIRVTVRVQARASAFTMVRLLVALVLRLGTLAPFHLRLANACLRCFDVVGSNGVYDLNGQGWGYSIIVEGL